MATLSSRKADILANSEHAALEREKFWQQAAFFHAEDLRYLRFLIPEGLRVLELGCGIGNTLAGLKPSFGLGVDFSPAMIERARHLHPELQFQVGDVEDPEFIAALPGPFDIILIVDAIGSLDDCQAMSIRSMDFAAARRGLSSPITRIFGSHCFAWPNGSDGARISPSRTYYRRRTFMHWRVCQTSR